ncbi:MAG: ACT domain-containing protein, partial [Oscillospiraceae bacterium]|nr:ACT domain-containing protein [Oscillospiraceae bacterium]
RSDKIEIESSLALIAVVGRGMVKSKGSAARIFSAVANAGVNIRMIDQGSSELNIILGVSEEDFETAIRAIYSAFEK